MAVAPESLSVPVDGGSLHVGVWPAGSAGARTVVAAHGITANHTSWAAVAKALHGDVTLVAPDLRGRGRSRDVGPPFGMAAHAADVVAVLDAVGATEPTVVVGHSMGAWVAACTAVWYPERVAAVVLVDGGFALAGTDAVPVDDALAAVLGPALARLSMTFASRDEYHAFWRQHPAVGGAYWSDDIADYVDYDLVGEPPEMRSSVSANAVRGDATDQLADPAVRDVGASVPCPAYRLFAPRGLLDGDPLYPAASPDEVVPDTNHYTILLGAGAARVAETVRRAAISPGPTTGVR
jgi:pimeloyl-ACP methyl ester carboxylesterase